LTTRRASASAGNAVGALVQVIERPEQQDGVEALVVERQLPRVADQRAREPKSRRLPDVSRHRIHQVHLVAARGQRRRVDTGPAADVGDRRGRRRQQALEQRLRADQLEPALGAAGQALGLLAAVVVVGDIGRERHVRRCTVPRLNMRVRTTGGSPWT
jgi:hypothetical protein